MLVNVDLGERIVGLKFVPDLTRGPLVLNPRSGELRGPAGFTRLSFASREMLAILMAGGIVPVDRLLSAAFPSDRRQPARPDHALRVRVMRLRAALAHVGLAGVLSNIHGTGYHLMLPSALRIRMFVGEQVDLLNVLLTTHPDQTIVAALADTSDRSTCA